MAGSENILLLRIKSQVQQLFGPNITRSDEYLFSLRLVTDNLPGSLQEIDRLYALTLFSRNMVVSLLMTAIIFLNLDKTIFLLAFIFSIIFYIRYNQLENATGNTVFRSAYVYLCIKEKLKLPGNENKPDNPVN
jgi:hypothetical protein